MDNPQSVLALARQGNVNAIASLLNQALGTENVCVTVSHQQECLHIHLEAIQVPEKSLYTYTIRAILLCLGLEKICTAQIYGKQMGETMPVWQQEVLFASPFGTLPAQDELRSSAVMPSPQPAAMTALVPHSVRQWRGWGRWSIALAVSFGLGMGLGGVFNPQWGGLTRLSQLNQTVNEAASDKAIAPARDDLEPAPPQPAPEAAQAIAATPPPPAAIVETEDTIIIKAVGDIVPGTDFPNNRLPADSQYLFNSIKPYLGEADLVFGNFESTLTQYPYSAKDTSRAMTFAFRTPPTYASLLKEAGFDVLSVANNHSMDFFEEGFNDTIAHIEQAGMKAVGRKGQIVYTEAKGMAIAWIGFSYLDSHNSMHDLEAAAALVQEAKQQADIVVISVHGGAEGTDAIHTRNQPEFFFSENRGNMVAFARTLIDQGADLILGHGPHVPRAIELYQGKLIAYSLGNFLGYRTLATEGALGTSMILQVQLDQQGGFRMGRIIPVALDPNGVPYLDDYFQSVISVRVLTTVDFPETPLLIDDMGYILKTN